MLKKIGYSLIVGIVTISLLPSIGMCWNSGYHGGSGRYYGGGYHGGYGGYHGGYNNNAWAWGLGGLVVGSALTAAVLYQPPRQVVYAYPPPQVVYAPPQTVVYAPAPTPVYASKPSIPPGMCRWERAVLDNYGRPILDQSGRPVLEYTIGSCQSPPY